jgi:hypothetical protein
VTRGARALVVLMIAGAAAPACSLSNAFFGFPDFQQVDNETACRDFQTAFQAAFRSCAGSDIALPIDSLCPERLNERDPRCASRFQCEQEALACVDGTVEGICEDATLSTLVCTDPFDSVAVEVSFTISIEGAPDCATAGIADVLVEVVSLDGQDGHFEPLGPCGDNAFAFVVGKSVFPARVELFGLDRPFEPGVSQPIYATSDVVVELADLTPEERIDADGFVIAQEVVDLGEIVLVPD